MRNTLAIVPPGRTYGIGKKNGQVCATLTFRTRHGDVHLSACVPKALAKDLEVALAWAYRELAKAVHQLCLDGGAAASHGLAAVPVPTFLSPQEAATALELAARAHDDDKEAKKKIRVIAADDEGRRAMQWAARAHLETRGSVTGEEPDDIAGDYIGGKLPKISRPNRLRTQAEGGTRETKADYVRKILIFGAKGQADYDARHA